MLQSRRRILIAPFSNSQIRDWPVECYVALIAILLDRIAPEEAIHVVGTANQRLQGSEIVRHYPATRVINECGRLTWPGLMAMVRNASCVVGNNSGIPHLAGYLKAPTVCVFGGSHERLEWRPNGFNVVVVSRVIGCSPCHLDHHSSSPYLKACLREIEPLTVADAAAVVMRRVAAAERNTQNSPAVTADQAAMPVAGA